MFCVYYGFPFSLLFILIFFYGAQQFRIGLILGSLLYSASSKIRVGMIQFILAISKRRNERFACNFRVWIVKSNCQEHCKRCLVLSK